MPGSTEWAITSTSIDPRRSTTKVPGSAQATAVTTASSMVPMAKLIARSFP